jgi:hypothetical protein
MVSSYACRLWAVTLIAAALPTGALAQVDQQALARTILGGDRQAAVAAVHETTTRLPAEEVGPALREALIAALERQNRIYEAILRNAAARPQVHQPPLSEAESARAWEESNRRFGEFWREDYGTLISAVIAMRDPQAIPALVGAAGQGHSVAAALAGFGEEAAPALLSVAEGKAWSQFQAAMAMRALVLMIEERRGGPLSQATLERIKRLVQEQLTTGTRYPSAFERAFPKPMRSPYIVTYASSLALALDDPPLRDMVTSLARDPEAVRRLGIERPREIEQVQRHAAEALARPPRRR